MRINENMKNGKVKSYPTECNYNSYCDAIYNRMLTVN